MTISELREHLDEYPPEKILYVVDILLTYKDIFDIDFCREIADRIDPYQLYEKVERKWLKIANICYCSDLKLWNERLNQVRELLK